MTFRCTRGHWSHYDLHTADQPKRKLASLLDTADGCTEYWDDETKPAPAPVDPRCLPLPPGFRDPLGPVMAEEIFAIMPETAAEFAERGGVPPNVAQVGIRMLLEMANRLEKRQANGEPHTIDSLNALMGTYPAAIQRCVVRGNPYWEIYPHAIDAKAYTEARDKWERENGPKPLPPAFMLAMRNRKKD